MPPGALWDATGASGGGATLAPCAGILAAASLYRPVAPRQGSEPAEKNRLLTIYQLDRGVKCPHIADIGRRAEMATILRTQGGTAENAPRS